MSTDIRLARTAPPMFPDRCVRCGEGEPPRIFRLKTRTTAWWAILFLWWGNRVHVEVPCCGACHPVLRKQRRLRFWITMVVLMVAVPIAATLLTDGPRPLRKLVSIGVALAVLLPILAWQVLRPPVIDISASSDHIDYEFADEMYAHEFAYLNGATVRE